MSSGANEHAAWLEGKLTKLDDLLTRKRPMEIVIRGLLMIHRDLMDIKEALNAR